MSVPSEFFMNIENFGRHVLEFVVEDPVFRYLQHLFGTLLISYPLFASLLIMMDVLIESLQNDCCSTSTNTTGHKGNLQRIDSQSRFDSVSKTAVRSNKSDQPIDLSKESVAIEFTSIQKKYWRWHPSVQALMELTTRKRPSFWARRLAYSMTFVITIFALGAMHAIMVVVTPLVTRLGVTFALQKQNSQIKDTNDAKREAEERNLSQISGSFENDDGLYANSCRILAAASTPVSPIPSGFEFSFPKKDNFPGEEDGLVHGLFDSSSLKNQYRRPRPKLFFILFGVFASIVYLVQTQDEYIFGVQQQFRTTITTTSETQHPLASSNASHSKLPKQEILPLHLTFENIGCHVPAVDRPILNQVSGEIHAGRFTAILGPSGSGKSVFAGILMGRSHALCSKAEGTIFLNGRQRSLNVILNHVGFVPQTEIFYPLASVEELLRFSADWRLPAHVPQHVRDRHLDNTIELMDLQEIRHEPLGAVLKRSLSGGERKRVSIAMELIAQPSVLILDEPTSGLDSVATFKLISILKKLSRSGVAVVAILHLPPARVFDLVDDLILFKQGECVYSGPRQQLSAFWKSNGFEFPDRNIYRKQVKSMETVTMRTSTSSKPVVSTPEFILDVLAETEPYPPGIRPQRQESLQCDDCQPRALSNETLAEVWRKEEQRLKQVCRKLYLANMVCHVTDSNATENALKTPFSHVGLPTATSAEQEWCSTHQPRTPESHLKHSAMLDRCYNMNSQGARHYCFLFAHLVQKPAMDGDAFPGPSNPGLFRQVELWFHFLVRISFRTSFTTIIARYLGVASLAMTSGWVRSYADDWVERASCNIIVSIAMSCAGVFTAVFQDDFLPARRFLDSGMILVSHHLALASLRAIKGMLLCIWFTVVYHACYRVRRGEWCAGDPRESYLRYLEFSYMMQLLFQCSHAIGSLMNLVVEQDPGRACIVSILMVMLCHVFSSYSPNKRQIELDSLLLGKYSIRRGVSFLTIVSPVKYFLEALLLWEPKNQDEPNRKFTLKYFSYVEGNRSFCCNVMFAQWQLMVFARETLYTIKYGTEYHVLHYAPLIANMFSKLIGLSFVFFAVVMVLHEWPAAWIALNDAIGDFRKGVSRYEFAKNNFGPDEQFDDEVGMPSDNLDTASNAEGAGSIIPGVIQCEEEEQDSDDVDAAKAAERLRDELLAEIEILRSQIVRMDS